MVTLEGKEARKVEDAPLSNFQPLAVARPPSSSISSTPLTSQRVPHLRKGYAFPSVGVMVGIVQRDGEGGGLDDEHNAAARAGSKAH